MKTTIELGMVEVELLLECLDTMPIASKHPKIRDIYCKLDDWRGETAIPVSCDYIGTGILGAKKCCTCFDMSCDIRCEKTKKVLETYK